MLDHLSMLKPEKWRLKAELEDAGSDHDNFDGSPRPRFQ